MSFKLKPGILYLALTLIFNYFKYENYYKFSF
jgi:hypothetical protein